MSTEPLVQESGHPDDVEVDAYNAVAIDLAARLESARRAKATEDSVRNARSLDQLIPPFNRAALGVHREYERMGNQPVSDNLLARAESFGIELEHLGMTIGTVLHNVDLKTTPSQELTRFIRDTLLERKVIFFRDQHLDEAQQSAFGRQFGELDAFPFGKPGADPFILEIEHGPNSPGSENGWHTDVTWMERPSLGSIAQCTTVPPVGGDTLFSDSHAAYLGLPHDLADRIEYLSGTNDYRLFLQGRGRGALRDDLIATIKQNLPFGVDHPLVRTHPETGKSALYIHGGFLRHDSLHDVRSGEALDPIESKEIVTALLAQHARPEYICRFAWEEGSIAFWDNRAVQHYAASDYYPHRRVLRRVTVRGDRPFYDPATS